AKKFLATVAFVALFRIVGLIPMPTVGHDYLKSATDAGRLNILILGIRPWVVAFLYVELLSFVFSRGRRLRRAGTVGRRRLNALAVRLGIVFAALQGAGIAIALSRQGLLVPDSLFGRVLTD